MNEQTLRDLYSRYRDPLFRFGYRLTGSAEAAEDMVHDVFVGLFKGAFDPSRASPSTYLFAGMRNQARKRLRDYSSDDAPADDLTDDRSGPLETLLSAETSDQVRKSVEALPFVQREALILFEYEDLSLDEIAKIVEAEVGTVKARLHRAREGLRRSLTATVKEAAK